MDGQEAHAIARQIRQGELLPVPRSLIEEPNENLFLLGYTLAHEDQGRDFSNGIRTYIENGGNLDRLREILKSVEDMPNEIPAFMRNEELNKFVKQLKGNESKALVSTLLGTVYAAFSQFVAGNPTASLLVGIAVGLLSYKGLKKIETETAIQLARDRAHILLALVENEAVRRSR